MHIRDALEKQQRENVGLEIRRIHGTPENIGRLPEMGFQLAECKLLAQVLLSELKIP